ncbi:MAG: uracil-DNA glycosylase [Pseudonocardiales bacterium]|jgi:DNA polymerase|nr:uracil-DNA glycosylase [Pseudonocardiales bacterium]
MVQDSRQAGAATYLPSKLSLSQLRAAARSCEGCDLYRNATQTVFGEGPARARLMLIGEQPGDVEDREGKPFVGPAGKLLLRALTDLGVERRTVYLTNAVKHFRWKATDRGHRRIHQTPAARHVRACRPWLLAEVAVVRPEVAVVLGAIAAKAVLGDDFRLTQARGTRLDWPAESQTGELAVFATVHPSAVLRAPDRDAGYRDFVQDLSVAVAALS